MDMIGNLCFGAGIILLLLAVFGAIAIYAKANPDVIRGWKAKLAGFSSTTEPLKMPDEPLGGQLATDMLPSDATFDNQLQVVSAKQTVTLVGDRERQVLAKMRLDQMWQARKDAPWTVHPRRQAATALKIAGEIWFFKIPLREKGSLRWLKGQRVECRSLSRFYLGDGTRSGPARRFREAGQGTEIPYSFPSSLGLSLPVSDWQVEDIGALQVIIEGKTEEMIGGDMFFHVVSSANGGRYWLLYLDARDQYATGVGGLFLCEQFEPEAEVKDLL